MAQHGHDISLMAASAVGGGPPCSRPFGACPAVGAIAPRAARVASLVRAVTGPDTAQVTLAVAMDFPRPAGDRCHLSLCPAEERPAAMGADPRPGAGGLQ